MTVRERHHASAAQHKCFHIHNDSVADFVFFGNTDIFFAFFKEVCYNKNMKTRRLTFKFTLFFTMCMLVILVITSLLSYFNQMQLYKQQREESIQYVANYLDTLVVTDGEDFLNMQRYFIAHYEDFRLPVHFDNDDIQKSRERYKRADNKMYEAKKAMKATRE